MENNQKLPVLIKDLGQQYATQNSKRKIRFGIFKCECGNEFRAYISDVKNGKIRSCGCYKKKTMSSRFTTHGLKKHPLYIVWGGMIQRTSNSKSKCFNRYGGRGIKVCERWKDFKNFYDDVIYGYKKGLTIDRINNDGNYEPSNFRWVSQDIQSQNSIRVRINNTSGYRGVSFHKHRKKWIAQIGVNGKLKYLGLFESPVDGAIAFDKYVIENNLKHTINFPSF